MMCNFCVKLTPGADSVLKLVEHVHGWGGEKERETERERERKRERKRGREDKNWTKVFTNMHSLSHDKPGHLSTLVHCDSLIEYPTLSGLCRKGVGREREKERERITTEIKSVGMPHSNSILCACFHDGSNDVSKLHFQWV